MEGVCRGCIWRGMLRGYAEGAKQRGYAEGYAEGYTEGVHGGDTQRGYMEGYMKGLWGVLPLATIDLMGNNRELGSFRDILRCYTHCVWLIVSEH